MKAIVLREFGGPEVLRPGDFPYPEPGPGEVVVRVRAAGVNHIDIWTRIGRYPTSLPHIIGADVAGEVAEVGDGVESVKKGDRVVIYPLKTCGRCSYCLSGRDSLCPNSKLLGLHLKGGYAEYVKVYEDMVFKIPGDVGFREAAAIPVNWITAWHMLFTRASLGPGDTILVIGGGSGIGYAAIELAKLVGAKVITTVGADWKVEKAKAIGADHVINRKKEDILETVMSLTDGEGVDLVFEHAGAAVWDKAVKSLKRGGTMVFAGATTGDEVKLSIRSLYRPQLNLHGAFLGHRSEFLKLLKLLDEGAIKPVIDSVYKLKDAAEAHRRMEASLHFGKIILEP